ncbi:MAG: helix-turn-helix domain-containing protein [Candidatus Dojkabacteria bacterium]|nr:MAG: helix-turn-helix domain-containing protein [Candidatus Dojkabacteria bacterium]
MTDDTYLTIEEVAEKLKVAYITVYRWVRTGQLKSVKAGKQHRIKQTDLDNFLERKNGA